MEWIGSIDSFTKLGWGLLYGSPSTEHSILDELAGIVLDGKAIAYLSGNFIYGRGFIRRFRIMKNTNLDEPGSCQPEYSRQTPNHGFLKR